MRFYVPFFMGLFFFSTLVALPAHADQTEFLKEVEVFLKGKTLPPAAGPVEPRVKPVKDGPLYHQDWFLNSFLNLKEDFEETKAEGKRLVVIFEQRGCGYCKAMHEDILSKKYVHDYIKANFNIIQLDMWGGRKVVDFDGKSMTEQKLARRWGAVYTPTVMFFDENPDLSQARAFPI